MKKKISLLLCLMMTAIVCLTGCGKTQTTLEYDEAMIEQETEFLINYCQNVDSDTLAQWNDQNEFSKEYQFMMSGLKFTPDSFDGAVDSWQAGIKECGEYVGHGDYTFEAKDDELTVSVPAQFKDRDATIEFVFDSQCEVLTGRDCGKGRLKYTAWNGNCICSTDLHFISDFFV